MRTRYRVADAQFLPLIRDGFAGNWPTEGPRDRSIVEPIVSKAVYEDEMKDWVLEHMDASGINARDGNALKYEYDTTKKRAPNATCGRPLEGGSKCQRTVVGNSGTLCFEHR